MQLFTVGFLVCLIFQSCANTIAA